MMAVDQWCFLPCREGNCLDESFGISMVLKNVATPDRVRHNSENSRDGTCFTLRPEDKTPPKQQCQKWCQLLCAWRREMLLLGRKAGAGNQRSQAWGVTFSFVFPDIKWGYEQGWGMLWSHSFQNYCKPAAEHQRERITPVLAQTWKYGSSLERIMRFLFLMIFWGFFCLLLPAL